MKIKRLSLISLFFALVPSYSNAASCSCISFFEEKPKPSWISAEKITDADYLTYGSTYCTGLQKIDTNRADQAALANLTRMIQAQVQSTQNIKQGNYGNGVAYSHLTENTTIDTNLMLNGSYIYDRWVDPQNCTIFSATKIEISEIEKSIAEQKLKESAKLVNQLYVILDSEHQIIKSQIETALSEIKVKFSNDKTALVVKSRVFDFFEKPGKLVKLMLELEIYNPNTKQIIWKKAYAGKGLSFQVTEKEVLIDKALNSAINVANKELKAFILQN
jgi:hypothetical protein